MKNVDELLFKIAMGKAKWSELYTEQELIVALHQIDTNEYKRRLCKGYQYIESFQKFTTLSPKQLTQLKRLSGEIFKYQYGY